MNKLIPGIENVSNPQFLLYFYLKKRAWNFPKIKIKKCVKKILFHDKNINGTFLHDF